MKKSFSLSNLLNKFSVNKYSKIFAIVPAIVVTVALVLVVALGLTGHSWTDAIGIGIDFEGGTVLTVRLGELAINDYDAQVEKITDAIEQQTDSDGNSVHVTYVQLETGNNENNASISFRYKNVSSDDVAVEELNSAIRDAVDKLYLTLEGNVTYESIGATAAHDLLSKAAIALVVSVALILVYIIIRFTLMSGFAAIIALIHDVVIMFALTVICRVQINSSYVAAMITIIAYSINNTIIIFDRCREYIKPLKGQKNIDYAGIGDMAVRDTFTRSIYTTLTTMVTVIFLAILGSNSIREFCVPIILGLVAGLYSSVCLATPLWSAMSISFDKTKEKIAGRRSNTVTYEKRDAEDDEEQISLASVDSTEIKPKSTKQAGQNKQRQNTIYKYSKKNTTFKKK